MADKWRDQAGGNESLISLSEVVAVTGLSYGTLWRRAQSRHLLVVSDERRPDRFRWAQLRAVLQIAVEDMPAIRAPRPCYGYGRPAHPRGRTYLHNLHAEEQVPVTEMAAAGWQLAAIEVEVSCGGLPSAE